MRTLAKIILPLLVLAAGVAGADYLRATKPQISPSQPLERVWTVSAATVVYGNVRPELILFGEVVAGREVEMGALVAGQIVEVGPGFMEGGTLRAGDLLVAIDPFEYQATLDEQEAGLVEARARLAEIEARHRAGIDSLAREREQLELAARNLARIEKLRGKGTVSAKSLDDAIMGHSEQRQRLDEARNSLAAEAARIDQQRAVIARARVATRRARRDLEQTRVLAPFEGFLLETEAELGKRVALNQRLAHLIDAGRLEVRFHLSDAQFGRILAAEGGFKGRPAAITWRTGERRFDFTAIVDRVSAEIEAASGGVDLYARVVDAGLERPLRPGAFVEVRIADRGYQGVARLPEEALYGGALVYVVDEGRLSARQVEVAALVGNDVLVSAGLEEGEQVVTTRFAEIGPGLLVELR